MKGRAVAAAVVIGVLAGTASAAVQGDDAPERRAAGEPAARPLPVPAARDTGRRPDGRYDHTRVHYRVHRARIAVRVDDPAGGPAWAVRVFDAEQLRLPVPARTLRGAFVVGRNRCAQLGRVRGGVFGWVYADGRFRRAGVEDALLQCTSRARPQAAARFETVLRVDDPAAPQPAATAVWGLSPGARTAVVAGTGGADGPAAAGGGAFLRVGPAGARARRRGRVVAGSRVLLLAREPYLRFVPPRDRRVAGRGQRFATVIPGTERVEARAPDPAGGPGYGVAVAETREGRPCVGAAGRVLGDRVGGVDLRLGLFSELAVASSDCPLEAAPTRERACDVSMGLGLVVQPEGEAAFLRAARIERRLVPGRTTVLAHCHPDVERVTLQTPRDVRTLVPSPVGHAILAVYDGTFPGGQVVLTAHLRGGATRTQRMPLG